MGPELSQHSGLILMLILMPGIAAGCGQRPTRHPVTCAVTLDGGPLSNVMVLFVPETPVGATRRSFGITDAEGCCILRGEDQGEGVLAGWYRVVIEDLRPYEAERGEEPPIDGQAAPRSRVPARYGSPGRTPLRVEVRAGLRIAKLCVENT